MVIKGYGEGEESPKDPVIIDMPLSLKQLRSTLKAIQLLCDVLA
jgi:hypothetical protein